MTSTCRFANAFGLGLAFFTRQQCPQLFFARQNLAADFVQRIKTGLNAAVAPGWERSLGGRHCGLHLGCVALGVMTDHVGQVARVVIRALRVASDPLAIDVVLKCCH